MEPRPKLKIEFTKFDKIIEAFCLTMLVALWVGTIAFFPKLPDEIPGHYNALGEADDFKDKASVFILPILATIMYIGMTIINRYPHIYNYPVAVTPQNAKRLYTSTTRLISLLKMSVVVIFSGIVLMTYKGSLTADNRLGTWFLPAAMAFTILPIVFYLLKPIKKT